MDRESTPGLGGEFQTALSGEFHTGADIKLSVLGRLLLPVAIKFRKLRVMYEPQAFEHSLKHSSSGTKPRWVKRTSSFVALLRDFKQLTTACRAVFSSAMECEHHRSIELGHLSLSSPIR